MQLGYSSKRERASPETFSRGGCFCSCSPWSPEWKTSDPYYLSLPRHCHLPPLKPPTHSCVTGHRRHLLTLQSLLLNWKDDNIWTVCFSLTHSFYILGDLSIRVCQVSYILASQSLNFLTSKTPFHISPPCSRPCHHTNSKILIQSTHSLYYILFFLMTYLCPIPIILLPCRDSQSTDITMSWRDFSLASYPA